MQLVHDTRADADQYRAALRCPGCEGQGLTERSLQDFVAQMSEQQDDRLAVHEALTITQGSLAARGIDALVEDSGVVWECEDCQTWALVAVLDPSTPGREVTDPPEVVPSALVEDPSAPEVIAAARMDTRAAARCTSCGSRIMWMDPIFFSGVIHDVDIERIELARKLQMRRVQHPRATPADFIVAQCADATCGQWDVLVETLVRVPKRARA